MTAALELFDRLEQLRYPTELTVSPSRRWIAFGALEAGAGAIHVIDPTDGATRVLLPPDGYTYGLIRSGPPGDDVVVAACGLADGELESIVAVQISDQEARAEVAVDGAIEDLVHAGGPRWLVRLADPGSERDGMHLGTRVFGIGQPVVIPPAGRWRRLALVDLLAGTVEPVPTPGWSIWDADIRGSSILAVGSRDPSPAGYYDSALLHLDVMSGQVVERYRSDRQLARPRLAPDARTGWVIEGRSIVSGTVRQIDLLTGEHHVVDGIGDVTSISVDGGRVWYAGWAGRGSFVATGPLGHEENERLDLDLTIHGVDGQPSVVPLGGSRCLAVVDGPDGPPEIAELDVALGTVERRTGLNAGVAEAVERPPERTVTWPSDGVEIHAGLIVPPGDGPHPLVVIVHGGPTWLWSTMYSPAESNQLALPIVAAGAAVLLPNPRGSSGRGLDFADAIAGRFGEADVADVLAGVDRLVADGTADPERVAIVGTSYGGYLAGWLAATTDRFRAAVAFSAVADWISFSFGSAIGGGFDRVYFPGADPLSPAGRAELIARSTVFQASSTRTPLMILHGGADRITPLGQADELADAWRRSGAPVTQVIYEDEGHEFVDPRHRRDAARRVLGFLAEHGILLR